MLRFKIFIALVFLSSTCSKSYGQEPCSIVVTGQIVSTSNGFAQPYQILLNDSITSITNDKGQFKFSNICSGKYSVTVKWGVFTEHWSDLSLKNDTTIRFVLKDLEFLSSLYVRDSFTGPNTFIKKRTLNKQDILALGGGNLSDLASNVSGVSSLKTGNTIAKPVVGGMIGRRVVIYNNGVRLEGQDWGSEHGPEIDAQQVNAITVIKGPGSLRYAPDAIGGLILVESAHPRTEYGVEAGINLIGMSNGLSGTSSGFVSGKSRKFPLSWRVDGTLKRLGNAHTPEYFLKNTGMSERNYSARLIYDKNRWKFNFQHSLFLSKVGIFSGSHIGNLTDLQNAFNAEQPFDSTGFDYTIDRPYQDIIHELSKAKVTFMIDESNVLEASYSRQYNSRKEFDKDLPLNDSLAALNLPDFALEITTHASEILWSHKINKQTSGALGVAGKHQGNTHAFREFIPNFRNRGIGVFWIERYTKKNYGLEAALRYDYNALTVYQRNENNRIIENKHLFSGISGSLGSIFALSKAFLLNANVSSGWRMPWVNELYSNGLHHGIAALEYGDENLEIERSIGVNLSPEYESDKLKLSMDIYGNLLNNYIFLRPSEEPTLTIQGAFPTFNFEQTNAWSGGIDFVADFDLTNHITLKGKGSIVRIQDRATEEFLPGTPSDRFSVSAIFKGKINQTKWSIAPRFDHIAKQWRVIQEADFVPPPEAYNLISATAMVQLPFKSNKLTIVLLVNNLLNIEYRDYLNQFRYYANDLGRNYTIKFNIPFNLTKSKNEKK